jgi:cholesterol transport system auxiliary component
MLSSLKSVRWSERIPRLLQLRLVRSLENKGMVRQIRFPSDPADAERQLLWEIPRFQIAIASDSSATVEIQVVGRIIDIHSGHVKAARIFSAKENLETVDIPQVVTAFDTALSTIMFEMCTWIG